MARRTVLITGALGQDGSLLAELLVARGFEVVGVARPSSKLPIDGALAAVRWETTDLTNAAAVRALLAEHRPCQLYHLAAAHHSSQQGAAMATPADRDTMCGTNFWATPLAVIRNGFRASYGFGFILDRNFQGDVFGADSANFRN